MRVLSETFWQIFVIYCQQKVRKIGADRQNIRMYPQKYVQYADLMA